MSAFFPHPHPHPRRVRAKARTRITTPIAIAIAIATIALSFLTHILRAYAQPQSGARIHLRGTARIDARAARAGSRLVLSGTLVDDAARPVASEKLTVSLSSKDEPTRALSLASASPSACADNVAASAQPTLERGDLLTLKTDDIGRFCVRLGLPLSRYVAHLTFNTSGNIDATKIDLPVDLSVRALTLRFDPEPRIVSLDGAPIALECVATTEEDGNSAPAANLALTLTSDSGSVLANGITNGSGRARVSIAPSSLGPPGKGEIRVAFPGSADTGSSVHVTEIERHTRVDLVVPDATGGRLATGAPEDGVAINVVARAKSEPGARVPGGAVEVRIGDANVGAAPLEDGKGRVVVTFATPAEPEVTLRLRYASDAPWYEPGNDVTVILPVRGPSPLRHLPQILAGVAVIAWLIVGRTNRARTKDKAPASRRPAFHGEARVEVVRAGPARRGWSGQVVDAHEGFAVSGARIAVERLGFEGVETLASTQTSNEGTFELGGVEPREGDRLSVEAPLHATLRQPLPPSGELAIAIVMRKRALLDRLVAWARRRGRPFDHSAEPTPGHVRRAAGTELAVARWADAVERAAYGGAVVDASAEADVDRLAPEESRAGEPARNGRPRPSAPDAVDAGLGGPLGPLGPHDTAIDPQPPIASDDEPPKPGIHAATLAGHGALPAEKDAAGGDGRKER